MSLGCFFGGGGVHCHIVELSMVVETLFALLILQCVSSDAWSVFNASDVFQNMRGEVSKPLFVPPHLR